MTDLQQNQNTPRVPYTQENTLRTTWLIAWRQVLEAERERSTLIMTGFFLLFQTAIVLLSLRSVMSDNSHSGIASAGALMAFYLLWVGLMPSAPAIGIAAGVFAGDKERGCLTPLLVTPASNTAIFAGKVLGAVIPALINTTIGIIVYIAEIALFFGPNKLGWFPVGITTMVLLLIPAIALLGSAIASIISSRVSTFQAAQNYSSLILIVIWIGLSALLFVAGAVGLWVFVLAVLATYTIDALLIVFSAITWRREEVMARQ